MRDGGRSGDHHRDHSGSRPLLGQPELVLLHDIDAELVVAALQLSRIEYQAEGGRILWDGADIRGLTLASLRGQIAVVAQETFLFNESIADNIAYGRPGASREKVVEAAKAANADAFIREQAQGYDTLVGERGVERLNQSTLEL